MIRIRRLPRRRLRRALYEVEYRPNDPTLTGWAKVTPYPVFDIEQIIGTGDAWSMIHAADADFSGVVGDWVTLAEGEDG